MKCDEGRLQSYLDGALSSGGRLAAERHLADCEACRGRLELLEESGARLTEDLRVLDPLPSEESDAAMALKRFHAVVQPVQVSTGESLRRRIEMAKQKLLSGRWRPAAIGLAALVLVVALFSFAPVRQAAADFLGVFRVRKFAVIPISSAQLDRLEGLGDLLETGVLGEPSILREPSQPQTVADAAEATALAGFDVRVPTYVPDKMTLQRSTVERGPAMRFEGDRAMMQALLEAVGVEDVTLPAVDMISLEADFPAMVAQEYQSVRGRVTIHQLPSPTVKLPAGVDPAVLGEALLRVLGMPAADAERVARTIDWTSTLVIPLPTDVARFREVEVDGAAGLLVEERRDDGGRRSVVVMWQRDGIVYMVNGYNIDPTLLLPMADSLR